MKSNSVKLAVIGLFIILAAAVCSAVSANSEGIYVDEVRFSENGQSIYTITALPAWARPPWRVLLPQRWA